MGDPTDVGIGHGCPKVSWVWWHLSLVSDCWWIGSLDSGGWHFCEHRLSISVLLNPCDNVQTGAGTQWVKVLSSGSQSSCKCRVGMVACLYVETETGWSGWWIGEFWVHVRDPASICKIESDQGDTQCSVSLPLIHTYIRITPTYSHKG